MRGEGPFSDEDPTDGDCKNNPLVDEPIGKHGP